ncbi:PilZ domain-containing protein [Kaarinaea lacus]
MNFLQSLLSRSATAKERRWDIRKPSEIDAAVCWGPSSYKRCSITSLSLTGMFLKLPNADIPAGSELDIMFLHDGRGGNKRCVETARVVRTTENGVAVCFNHFNNQHQTNIQIMLHMLESHKLSVSQAVPHSPAIADAAVLQQTTDTKSSYPDALRSF